MGSAWVFVCFVILVLIAGCRPRTYNDGSYKGTSTADSYGYAVAEVVIRKDRIVSVNLIEITEKGEQKDYETYPYPQAKTANETMARRFVEKNSAEVDVVAGATNSSSKYILAVKHALEKARKKPLVTTRYFDGTYMGVSAKDEYGRGIAWVTIQNDRITKVVLEEVMPDGKFKFSDIGSAYSYPRVLEARDVMQRRFAEANGPNVDAFSGATQTSKKWVDAVTDALNNAFVR